VDQVIGEHRCLYTVVQGDTLAGIATNLQEIFPSISPPLSVADLQRLNRDAYPSLATGTDVQIGWVLRFCFEEGQRGFIVTVPKAPPSGAAFDMVDTNIFQVRLKSQPTSDVTLDIATSAAAVVFYDQDVQGAIVFTQEDWHQDKEVLLADVASGTATLTITGTGGDYGTAPVPSETVTYLKSPQGNCSRDEDTTDPNECECASMINVDVPVKCDESFCSVSGPHCEYIDGTSDQSNMAPGANQDCTAPAGGKTPCDDWVATLEWMPDGYLANLQAWCETEFPFNEAEKSLMECVVNQSQVNIAAFDSGYTDNVELRVDETPLYDREAKEALFADLLNGWDSNDALSDKLREAFRSAYATCCCAVSPGPFLGWLSANPGQVTAEVVQFNTILFGRCEDRSKMGKKNDIRAYFWLDALGARFAWCYDILGEHCNATLHCNGGDLTSLSFECDGADPPDKPGPARRSLSAMLADGSLPAAEGALSAYNRRGRRGLTDWLAPATIPCLKDSATVFEWPFTFFE